MAMVSTERVEAQKRGNLFFTFRAVKCIITVYAQYAQRGEPVEKIQDDNSHSDACDMPDGPVRMHYMGQLQGGVHRQAGQGNDYSDRRS